MRNKLCLGRRTIIFSFRDIHRRIVIAFVTHIHIYILEVYKFRYFHINGQLHY